VIVLQLKLFDRGLRLLGVLGLLRLGGLARFLGALLGGLASLLPSALCANDDVATVRRQ